MSTETPKESPEGEGERGRFGDRGRGGRGRGGRGRGGRGGRGRGGPRGKAGAPEKKPWVPITKLGRLVQAGKIRSLEEVYLFSLPVKEVEIIEHFLPSEDPHKVLKDEVMKISPVQKQTAAGQRTKFKAIVCVGDHAGHVGLGAKVAKEVATAIRGALIAAKLAVVPVRRGYWGGKMGEPHTVPCKLTGKSGSVRVRLVPAPRGAGLVCGRVPKKLLTMAGFTDVYTNSRGSTRTAANFLMATFEAVKGTYAYLTPDLWPSARLDMAPFQAHSGFLAEKDKSPPLKA